MGAQIQSAAALAMEIGIVVIHASMGERSDACSAFPQNQCDNKLRHCCPHRLSKAGPNIHRESTDNQGERDCQKTTTHAHPAWQAFSLLLLQPSYPKMEPASGE